MIDQTWVLEAGRRYQAKLQHREALRLAAHLEDDPAHEPVCGEEP